MGMLFAEALEPFGLYWFEEPCWPERRTDIAAIQRSVTTPIATGERLVGAQAFARPSLEAAPSSVIQPDITHCGGLTEVRRIAALAEVHRVALAPHNPQGPVSTAASIELGFATPSYIICEAVTSDVPWRAEVASESHPVDRNGMLARPSGRPGLGIEIDLDVVAQHPVRAGAAAARLLRGRQRRRLVANATVGPLTGPVPFPSSHACAEARPEGPSSGSESRADIRFRPDDHVAAGVADDVRQPQIPLDRLGKRALHRLTSDVSRRRRRPRRDQPTACDSPCPGTDRMASVVGFLQRL